MRTAHARERHTKPKQGRLNRRPSRYQQWRGEAWCVVLRGRKRRCYHRRSVWLMGLRCGDGGHVSAMDYLTQVRMGQS